MMSIIVSGLPQHLSTSLRANPYVKMRDTVRLLFYATNKRKIGLQSLKNRLSDISKQVDFEWLAPLSRDLLHVKLKQNFFSYFKP